MADSAIDLSIPRALSPEPILSIDYDGEDNNQDSGIVQESDHANQEKDSGDDEDEDLDDTAEVDVESVSNQDEFDAIMEDHLHNNPIPMESTTSSPTRCSTPVSSAASSPQCSPTRSNTPTRSSTPLPSTSTPKGLEGGIRVGQISYFGGFISGDFITGFYCIRRHLRG